MNSYIFNNKKKLTALAAVILVCAACLVTAAYAYSAEYKDKVEQKEITPSEISKYIYIDGNLEYQENSPKVAMDVEYKTVTDYVNGDGTTTVEPVSMTITGLSGETEGAITYLPETHTAKVLAGTLTVHNNTGGAVSTKISVGTDEGDFKQSPLGTVDKYVLDSSGSMKQDGSIEAQNLFSSALTADNIQFFVDDNSEPTNIVAFSADEPTKTVKVYVVGEIRYSFAASEWDTYFYPPTNSLTSEGTLSNNTGTYLVIPGFSISVDVNGIDQTVSGTVSSSDISTAKAVVSAGDSDYTLTIVAGNDSSISGATLTMNASAVATLAANEASLSVSASDIEVGGATAVYDISFGNNHFGASTGSVLKVTVPYDGDVSGRTVKIAYVDSNGTVSEAYGAEYDPEAKTIAFSTTHLSTYAVYTDQSKVPSAVATVTYGDSDNSFVVAFADLADAVANAIHGEKVALIDDVTLSSTITVAEGNTLDLDLGGKTITANRAFIVGRSASMNVTGNDGKIDASYCAINAYRDSTLKIDGGSYSGNYAIMVYPDNNDNSEVRYVEIKNAEITGMTGIWLGRTGANEILIEKTNITTMYVAIYMGTVNKAVLTDVTATSSQDDALDIKSGSISINRGSYTGASYSATKGVVNYSGTGDAHAPITVLDAYNKDAEATETIVNIIGATVSYASDAKVDANAPVLYIYNTNKDSGRTDVTVNWYETYTDETNYKYNTSGIVGFGVNNAEKAIRYNGQQVCAAIGAVGYLTLFDALRGASSDDKIDLIADSTGVGIGIYADTSSSTGFKIGTTAGQFEIANSLTIDLNGHTYTVDGVAVGSGENYQSQGFHIEKGYVLTIKNGTIDVVSGQTAIKQLVHNYADLTLTDVTVDGTNVAVGDWKNTAQTICSENGVLTINGSTSIKAAAGGWALVANWWGIHYSEGTQVTINSTGVIDSIALTLDSVNESPTNSKTTVTVEKGTVNSVVLESDAFASKMLVKDTSSITPPSGYIWQSEEEYSCLVIDTSIGYEIGGSEED